jgi:hypothetical protein
MQDIFCIPSTAGIILPEYRSYIESIFFFLLKIWNLSKILIIKICIYLYIQIFKDKLIYIYNIKIGLKILFIKFFKFTMGNNSPTSS